MSNKEVSLAFKEHNGSGSKFTEASLSNSILKVKITQSNPWPNKIVDTYTLSAGSKKVDISVVQNNLPTFEIHWIREAKIGVFDSRTYRIRVLMNGKPVQKKDTLSGDYAIGTVENGIPKGGKKWSKLMETFEWVSKADSRDGKHYRLLGFMLGSEPSSQTPAGKIQIKIDDILNWMK